MLRLPPAPLGQPPGHSFWNDWYEKLRKLFDEINLAVSSVLTNVVANNRLLIGVNTPDYVIIDDTVAGLVLKSPDGNYWRLNVNDAGLLTITGLGLIRP